MADAAAKVMVNNNLTKDDVDWLIPHQANKRIISATRERMGLEEEKVLMNIGRYGNTTSATLPLLLYDYEQQLKGQHICCIWRRLHLGSCLFQMGIYY